MEETLTLQFDGGSRGNPGPAGIGVVVMAADGTPLVTLGRFIGRATNNVAEYRALITAMQEALKLGAKRVIIRGDSELIIKQMRGEYRVRNPDMKVLYDEAKAVIVQFQKATIEHNLRHKNELADTLANLAMDRKADVTEVPGAAKPSGAPGVQPGLLDTPSPRETVAGEKFGCARCGCSIEVLKPSGIRPHQLKPFVCQCGGKMDRGEK
jgi:ribonuclease HI